MKYTKAEQKKNRKKWIAALRSGKYKQGLGLLCSLEYGTPRYCCLGVLCEIFKVERKVVGGRSVMFGTRRTADDSALCSKAIRDIVGLTAPSGTYLKNGHQYSLANDNDYNGYSFKRIAKIIESEPKGLFKK